MPNPDPTDPHPDSPPQDEAGSSIEQVDNRRDDSRSDLEQAVAARSDAVERGEGGPEPAAFTDDDIQGGVGGTGGEVKNQNDDAQ